MSDSAYLPKEHFDATWDQEILEPDELELPEIMETMDLIEDTEQISDLQGPYQKGTDDWNDHGMEELLSVTIGEDCAEKAELHLHLNESSANA
jgi:hypothetical protein